jgi:low temperature requirement protein LtrA
MDPLSPAAQPSERSRRVSTLELFFDLVFVFAFTQVTSFMVERQSALSVLEALVILALLWWTWASYSWLGNHIRIDQGVSRVVLLVAICATFVVALSIPTSFDSAGREGLRAGIVLAVAYAVVRFIHLALYLLASRGDRALQRQILRSSVAMVAGVAFVFLGAIVGGEAQVWLWLAGVAIDFVLTYLTSANGSWQVRSASHWAERYGLVVMLALGESVIAARAGALGDALTPLALVISGLSIVLSIAMWWLYFDSTARAGELRLERLQNTQRAALAGDAYTYIHFPLIVGIILSALGVEIAIDADHQGRALGLFGSAALFGGTALFVFALALFRRRLSGGWQAVPLVSATLLLGLAPLASGVDPAIALSFLVVLVVGAAIAESILYRSSIAAIRRSE